jgi:protein involved in polysaccharide export with SLBB domain
MDAQEETQEQARHDGQQPKVRTRRGRAKQIALVLTAGAVGVAALEAAGPLRDRNAASNVLSAMMHEAIFQTGRHKAQTVAASAAKAPTVAINAAETLKEGTRLASDRTVSAPTPTNAPDPAASRTTAAHALGIGDQLKVVFYERVKTEDEKWGHKSSALSGIQQRPELSGDYTVQGDGTITVPLLGSVQAAARSEQQVRAALAEAFDKMFGRKAIVDVMLQARSPIYVLGPVKHPGSFKYVPGMTVLYALALAGGMDRATVEPWQKVEAIRTIDKRRGAVESMLKLIARSAVLRAEREGTAPKVPRELMKLVGATEANTLIDEQIDHRKAITMARKNREQVADGAVQSAKQDLNMYTRTNSLNELVKSRRQRLENIRSLVKRNILNKAALDQAQAELSDAQQRRQDAFNQYSMAKQRLATLKGQALQIRSDMTNDLEAEIETTKGQIASDRHEFATSDEVLDALPATRTDFRSSESRTMTYRIVRQTSGGPVEIDATGMTVLKPGDLVHVGGAIEPAAQNQPQTQPKSLDHTPIGNGVDEQETLLIGRQN